MEPLNNSERSNALWKFISVYLLILIIPIAAFYLFFYIPNQAMEEENARLKAVISEQQKLITALDTMGRQLKKLEAIDGLLAKQGDEFEQAQTLRILKEYENNIQSLQYETKRDSSALQDRSSKVIAKGVINSLDAFLTYRNTIALLRQTIKEKGISSEEIERLNTKIRETETQLETCKLMLAAKPKESGGGGGGSSREVDELKAQIKDYESKLKALQANQKPDKGIDVSKYDERIAELELRLTMEKAICDESKAESRIINCNQRKSLYQSALAVYTKLQTAENETIKKEAQKKVTEINAKIKKPPVGCE
jgi:hypothetical protein